MFIYIYINRKYKILYKRIIFSWTTFFIIPIIECKSSGNFHMKRPATNAQRSDGDSGFCTRTQIHFYTIHIIYIYVYICVIVEQVFGRKFVFPRRLFPRGKNVFRQSPCTKRSLPFPASSLIIGTYFSTMNYSLTWYFKFLPTRNFYRFDAFITTTLRLYYASILSLYAVYSIPLNNARRTMSIEIRVYYLRIYKFTYCRYILYCTLHLYIYIKVYRTTTFSSSVNCNKTSMYRLNPLLWNSTESRDPHVANV